MVNTQGRQHGSSQARTEHEKSVLVKTHHGCRQVSAVLARQEHGQAIQRSGQ